MIAEPRCQKCGSDNIYWREEHPDTGMDEMVMVCRDCAPEILPLPWKFIMREKLSMKWHYVWGYVIRGLFKLARWATNQTFGYCSWCGSQPGFSSSVSRKGLRCSGCQDK